LHPPQIPDNYSPPPQPSPPPVIKTSPLAPRTKTTQQCITPPATNNNHARKPGKTGRNIIAYNILAKTATFPVVDQFVCFTHTFRYLGSLINYSLRDNDDITARIASATAAMGALKEIWHNPHLDICNKYLIFHAIPMNLLLWGAETWSLQKTQLDQLKVFPHRSIHQILQISMTKVKENRIRNEQVCEMFYSIPCVRNMIAVHQANFIGKMI
jgi:hypothetical protein